MRYAIVRCSRHIYILSVEVNTRTYKLKTYCVEQQADVMCLIWRKYGNVRELTVGEICVWHGCLNTSG